MKAATALLLASESRVLQQAILPDPPMAANVAMKSTKPWHTNYGRSSSNKGERGAYGQNTSSSRGNGRGQPLTKPVCQLYDKIGHVVQKCYHRFDVSFHRVSSTSHSSEKSSGNTGSSSDSSSFSGMQASVATQPEFVVEHCWSPYSGATNHVTDDLANLQSILDIQAMVYMAILSEN